MNLSKRCEYALRTLIALGIAGRLGRPVLTLGAIARQENIPVRFLEQILRQLLLAGFVQSRRGKKGGYALGRPAAKVPMGDVVRLVDGPLAPISCVSKTGYERCSCPDEDHCGLHLLMGDVRSAVADVLDRRTLADVVADTLDRLQADGVHPPFAKPGA